MSESAAAHTVVADELTGARLVGYSYEPAMFVLRFEAPRRDLELDVMASWRYLDESEGCLPEEQSDLGQQRRADAMHAARLVGSVDRAVTTASVCNDGSLRIAFDDRSIILVPGVSRIFDVAWMLRVPQNLNDRRSVTCDSEGNVVINWP